MLDERVSSAAGEPVPAFAASIAFEPVVMLRGSSLPAPLIGASIDLSGAGEKSPVAAGENVVSARQGCGDGSAAGAAGAGRGAAAVAEIVGPDGAEIDGAELDGAELDGAEVGGAEVGGTGAACTGEGGTGAGGIGAD